MLFLISMAPVVVLVALLTWGLFRSDADPGGGRLVHNDFSETSVSVRRAPEFGGTDVVTGGIVSNDSVHGSIVMLDFWSSWCVACRAEAADLAETYAEYADMPVEFVGLAIWDDAGSVLRYIERYGVPYPNLLDAEGRTAVTFGVTGVPEKFFLDQDGVILRKVIGAVSKEQLRSILDELLAS